MVMSLFLYDIVVTLLLFTQDFTIGGRRKSISNQKNSLIYIYI